MNTTQKDSGPQDTSTEGQTTEDFTCPGAGRFRDTENWLFQSLGLWTARILLCMMKLRDMEEKGKKGVLLFAKGKDGMGSGA